MTSLVRSVVLPGTASVHDYGPSPRFESHLVEVEAVLGGVRRSAVGHRCRERGSAGGADGLGDAVRAVRITGPTVADRAAWRSGSEGDQSGRHPNHSIASWPPEGGLSCPVRCIPS